ncbi:anthrone oxygenase family protein [Streptomyces sp. NPDC006283]|uniref:anthrone oxygenase family protein n=1 Tax=Streptomyces sp. NPDC006283 TaxID=3156741 RepID=UPI0033A56D9F
MTQKRGARAVLASATVATGLVAGVWYAFACAVMPALGRSEDRTYVEVMQNINEVIENPVFFAGFFGALILTAVSAWQLRRTPTGRWVTAALVLYVLVFLVTSAANVPLNNELAAAGAPKGIADPGAVRESFEDPWVLWNIVRALLTTAALVCLWRATSLLRAAHHPAGGQTSAYLASDAGSRASR